MSGWRTLGDGRKVIVQGACDVDSTFSTSKNFKNPESLIKMGINRDKQSRLFATLCFWCKAPVYFVENGRNGGCFLADRLPEESPWKIHSCWELNKGYDKQYVINHYRRKSYEAKCALSNKPKSNKINTKTNILKSSIRKLHLHHWPKSGTKTYLAKFEHVDIHKLILINGQIYQIAQFREKDQIVRVLILSDRFPIEVLGGRECVITLTIRRFHKEKVPFISSVIVKEKKEIYNPKQIVKMIINHRK